MLRSLLQGFLLVLFLTVLTGLLYPAMVAGLCQLCFPRQAQGSLVRVGNQVVGSVLLGQNFTRPEYFHPRPSAAGVNGYDPLASGGSNLGPTNQKLIDRVGHSMAQLRKENPGYSGPIPVDLVTASASGLDPDISPAAARVQSPRVAQARGTSQQQIDQLISQNITPPTWGFLGEPRVNVLRLNLAMDQRFPRK